MRERDEREWTFEAAFTELEETVARLEAGGLTLDESLEVYEWARKLADWCMRKLDAAELRVQQLTEAGDVAALTESAR